MNYGFIKVAAATPEIRVADCAYNTEAVLSSWKEADALGCHLVAFPELVLTGVNTCAYFDNGKNLGDLIHAISCIPTQNIIGRGTYRAKKIGRRK